jgi:glycosyltransferase involved in cell wall biosynthesis
MRVVIDGVPIRGTSLAIVVENLLHGWDQLDCDDDIHIVVGPDAPLALPASVTVHRVPLGRVPFAGRLQAQNVRVPQLCRRVEADVMLGVIPATTVGPLPCPRGIIALDLRHELRPEQFSRQARLKRRASYAVGYRQAAAIICISERTRQDLLTAHPGLQRRLVRVAPLGADHVLRWPPARSGPPFALAFGQWGNKNVQLVIDGWSLLHARGQALPLTLLGLPEADRAAVQSRVDRLGLAEVVTVLPWLDPAPFQQQFASASLVVFPSDFEGFGLPAAEAMRLGIPLVVTPDQALLEVTAGRATVMDGWDAEALARAVPLARQAGPDLASRARIRAAEFTWRRTASEVRATLSMAVAGSSTGTPEDHGSGLRPAVKAHA